MLSRITGQAEVEFTCEEHEEEFVRRVQESSARRLPSLFVADRERILQGRAVFEAVMQQLATQRLELGENVANRVRQERLAAGLTQAQLAEATGIWRPNISRLEKGRYTPTFKTLGKVADALGVSVTTLVDEPEAVTA